MYLRHGLDVLVTENTQAKNKSNFPATGISPDENLFFCDDFGRFWQHSGFGFPQYKLVHERLDSKDVAHKYWFCGNYYDIIGARLIYEQKFI